jgi:hypothetical protein
MQASSTGDCALGPAEWDGTKLNTRRDVVWCNLVVIVCTPWGGFSGPSELRMENRMVHKTRRPCEPEQLEVCATRLCLYSAG